ncbi:unnamed protein product [Sphagnum balticum]
MSNYPGSTGKQVVLLDTGSYPSFSNFLNETWTFNGTDWTNQSTNLINPSGPLPGRTNASLGYDGTNLMLFGGQGGSAATGVLDDTWVWNGTTWTQLGGPGFSLASPSGRFSAGFSNHNTNQVVMFGGTNLLYKLLETWIWNGSTQLWTQVAIANGASPNARTDHMMAGNTSGTTVLFGGQGTNSQFNDTWTFNGTAWTQKFPSVSPSVRSDAAMTYDSTNGIFVMFGGRNEYNYLVETWTYNVGTNTWAQVAVPNGTGPVGRIGAQMCYDPQSAKTLMFGGLGAGANYPLQDTWSFNSTTLTWTAL